MRINLQQGDCLELMKGIPDGSIDMILADLPYGVTGLEWDTIIPFEPLWEQYKRIIKHNGAIVLTASQPFTSALVMSNPKMFRYEWVWRKSRPSNPFLAKKQPLRYHENVLVFYKKQPTYNPVMKKGEKNHATKGFTSKHNIQNVQYQWDSNTRDLKYPSSVIDIKSTDSTSNLHPTQKPVALMEYLIKTYTNTGETVLDNTMGSGSTGVACVNTNRNFIGMELDEEYFNIAKERIEQAEKLSEEN